jgi:hypothetical protein
MRKLHSGKRQFKSETINTQFLRDSSTPLTRLEIMNKSQSSFWTLSAVLRCVQTNCSCLASEINPNSSKRSSYCFNVWEDLDVFTMLGLKHDNQKMWNLTPNVTNNDQIDDRPYITSQTCHNWLRINWLLLYTSLSAHLVWLWIVTDQQRLNAMNRSRIRNCCACDCVCVCVWPKVLQSAHHTRAIPGHTRHVRFIFSAKR